MVCVYFMRCKYECHVILISLSIFIDNAELAGLMILPALLPDARCKVDVSKIVYVAKVNRKIVHIKSFYMCIQDTTVPCRN